MMCRMPALVTPTTRLHRPWLEARDDWGRDAHQDGAGLQPGDDVDSPAGFAAWVDGLVRSGDPDEPVAEGRVHCTYRWIVEDGAVLGAIALRHRLNERHGGVLEDVRDTELGRLNRYWIDCA